MSAGTELDDVMALLEQVLPDPAGYGKRLLQQFVLEWASAAPTPATVVAGETDDEDTDDVATSPTAALPTLLASALGACDCWGARSGCPACHGAGSPGWTVPDPDLFQTYVAPAAARLGSLWAADLQDDEDDRGDHHQRPRARPREGVNA